MHQGKHAIVRDLLRQYDFCLACDNFFLVSPGLVRLVLFQIIGLIYGAEGIHAVIVMAWLYLLHMKIYSGNLQCGLVSGAHL